MLMKFSFKWGHLWRIIQFTSTNTVEHITFWKLRARWHGGYNNDTRSLLLEDFFLIYMTFKKKMFCLPMFFSALNWNSQDNKSWCSQSSRRSYAPSIPGKLHSWVSQVPQAWRLPQAPVIDSGSSLTPVNTVSTINILANKVSYNKHVQYHGYKLTDFGTIKMKLPIV